VQLIGGRHDRPSLGYDALQSGLRE
jgi:hypothetical protein